MPDAPPERAPAEEQHLLLDQMRRTVVENELHILELNDKLDALRNSSADAVDLLGQAELLLEQKVGYILNLDQALTARARDLEAECDRKSEEIEKRGVVIGQLRADGERDRQERDAVITDLSQRLDSANQEISRAHGLAGDYAAKWEHTKQELASCRAQYEHSETQLAITQDDLRQTQSHRDDLHRQLGLATDELANLRQRLELKTQDADRLDSALRAATAELARIHHSALWKLGRPWRALFGPK